MKFILIQVNLCINKMLIYLINLNRDSQPQMCRLPKNNKLKIWQTQKFVFLAKKIIRHNKIK